MHIVIGKGNLGVDLCLSLAQAGLPYMLFSPSTGFSWPKSQAQMASVKPTHIWMTAGFGSVEACGSDFDGAFNTHVRLPWLIAHHFPQCKIVCFSSDYAASEVDPQNPNARCRHPRSYYALTKLWMEDVFRFGRPNAAVIRVGSLYGNHFLSRTFPGKVHEFKPNSLPTNIVVPTPTWWLGKLLVASLPTLFRPNVATFHHAAPKGPGIRISDWGRLITPGNQIEDRGLDPKRPVETNMGCTLAHTDTWQALWNAHWGIKPSKS